MKSHHSDEATCYPCRKCPKKCFTKQILKEHMEEFHTTTSKGEPNSTIFKCQLCDEKGQPQPKLTHVYAFKLHLKKLHNVSDVDHYKKYFMINK